MLYNLVAISFKTDERYLKTKVFSTTLVSSKYIFMTISDNKLNSLPKPPGDSGLPFIGETIAFFSDPDFNQKRIVKYGKIYKTNIFGTPTVMMVGSQANTFLFKNEHKYLVSSFPKSAQILLGKKSLSVNNGSFHTSRRKLLYQAFQPRALSSYIPTMERITEEYMQKWSKKGNLTWYSEIRNYTFDIASNLFLGGDGGSKSYLAELFIEFSAGLFTIPLNLPWTKFGKALKARQKLLKHLELIVIKRQQAKNPGTDALGLLIQAKDEEGNSLTLEELKDQVLLLLFAGHETLTSAISSFCLLTAQHPEVLEKLREEQDRLNITGTPTLEDLKAKT